MKIGTILDYSFREPKFLILKCFLSFSVRRNLKKLLSTSNTSSNSVISINGLRVISMIWIIFGHIYKFIPGLSLINRSDIAEVGILNVLYYHKVS